MIGVTERAFSKFVRVRVAMSREAVPGNRLGAAIQPATSRTGKARRGRCENEGPTLFGAWGLCDLF